jgi:uncharacterized protein YdeI (YjbR/CyaY-like superfamily)
MNSKQDLPIIAFASPAAWEAWLAEQHTTSCGLWLKIAKKDSSVETVVETVTYAEALEVALCYGWIDGQKDKFDGDYWLQRFTPRKPRSKWSKVNRERAEQLITQGRMQPAGLREVEQARADGRWDAAYDGQRTAGIPDDLRQALEQNPKAAEFFASLDSANRYAILYRLQEAKKPETRARRLERYVGMLNEQQKIHP